MIDQMFADLRRVNDYWSQMTTSLLRGQWLMLEAGFEAADSLLRAATQPSAPAGVAAKAGGSLDNLVGRALERVSKGQPPPRELYDVKYREQIDWLRFPAWARPSDPEAFTGCGHEG